MALDRRHCSNGWTSGVKALPEHVATHLSPRLQKALDNPTRREILRLLQETHQARSVPELRRVMCGRSAAEMAFHARLLCECEVLHIVRRERVGTSVTPYYSLPSDIRSPVAQALAATTAMDSSSLSG
jgi:DNA-binding transcriptional ArsR family regulator